jgi:thiamine biosynthesis lipoprotein
MNPYVTTSSLYHFNSVETQKKVEIPAPLREILKISLNLYKYTDGYFNVAVLPVVELWGFYTDGFPAKPDVTALEEALKFSSLGCYEFKGDSVQINEARCKIGLGGIAKGYAVDSVATYLSSEGYTDFIVEAGGDMMVKSSSQKVVGIRHPRIESSLIDTIYIKNGAVATSGDYEKFIVDKGVRYCHIINPYTGYGLSDVISVTIVSGKTYLSDAFATAAFAMGKEKAEYLILKNDLSGIIYYLNSEGEISKKLINMDSYLRKELTGR